MNVQSSYDIVAREYAKQFHNEMSKKPFDRKILDWLIEKVGKLGGICDMGCGPGQIADYLHYRGAKVCGIDLSSEMIKQAQNLNPKISFQQGDMLALTGIANNSFGGITAFYSIVNLPKSKVVLCLKELNRVLHSKGTLLLSFHIGKETVHLEDWWEKKVSLDFHFFETKTIKKHLEKAGFVIEEVIERDPYPEIEYQSRRAFIFAKKT